MIIQSTPQALSDRLLNPLPVTYNHHATYGAHVNTQRRIYTVPTGKGAVLYGINTRIQSVAVPTGVLEHEITFDLVKGLDYDIEIFSNHFLEDANHLFQEANWMGVINLEEDQALRASTVNFTTTGTANYTYNVLLLQYDLA